MGVKVQSYWRHLTARVAILGLVFQAVVAAAMLPMPLILSSGAQASPLDGGAIVVCTGTGFKLITIDENGNPVEKTLPGQDCPVCAALAAVAFADQAAPPVVTAPPSNPDVLLPVNEHIPASIACLAHNNRGPPNLV